MVRLVIRPVRWIVPVSAVLRRSVGNGRPNQPPWHGKRRSAAGFLARCVLGGLLVAAGMTTACQAADNPLIGSWRWDLEKTLRNIHPPAGASKSMVNSATKAKKFVEGLIRK